jgi:hypothetical protein
MEKTLRRLAVHLRMVRTVPSLSSDDWMELTHFQEVLLVECDNKYHKQM